MLHVFAPSMHRIRFVNFGKREEGGWGAGVGSSAYTLALALEYSLCFMILLR